MKPPFEEGDLLCLDGPGVWRGRHVHVAGAPNRLGVRWANGYRPWGCDGGVELRHATIEDIEHCMRIELDDLERTAAQIARLRNFRQQLLDTPA